MGLSPLHAPEANTRTPSCSYRPSLRLFWSDLGCLFEAADSSLERSQLIILQIKRQGLVPKGNIQQPHMKVLWGNSSKPPCTYWQRQVSITVPSSLNWMAVPSLPAIPIILLLGKRAGESFQINPCGSQGNLGSLASNIKASLVSIIPKRLALNVKLQ